jgi:osmoprotectant transport system substrate-binding protein
VRRTLSLAAALLVGALALTACGGDSGDPFTEQTAGSSGSGEPKGTVVVGGANFTEMLIMQAIYVELLENAGYETKTVTAGQREVYFPELGSGDIGVVPEYAATLAEYLNVGANGADAPPIATSDAQATVEAMRPLAEKQGVVLLEPAKAADQNGYAVAKDFAGQNSLKTLSDLGALGQPIVLAATEECPERPFCGPGLTNTYGIQISEVKPTGFDTPQTKQAVQSGEAQLGLVATTDGTLDQFDLVLLDDDKHLQLADNLVPAVNADLANDADLVEALNSLSDVLTTEDLVQLNAKVDSQRMQPADVAQEYLQSKDLIG